MDGATKEALLSVVQVWLDRLQTMAVITTFFVSIDSMLYGYASAGLPLTPSAWSNTDLLKAATLGGAIILHVCASILAYLASFVLIRYRLETAEEQAQAAEYHDRPPQSPPAASSSPMETFKQPARATALDLRALVTVYEVKPLAFVHRRSAAATGKAGPETPDPDANEGDAEALRTLQSMVRTLTRCHTVVAAMSNAGFILALIGTITYFWTALPVALGAFASACLGASFVAGVFAIL